MTRITKLMDPALAYGEYIGATLIGASAAAPLAAALEATWRRIPRCTTRTASRNSPTAAARSRSRRSARSSGSRSTTTTTCAGLARSPLAADCLGRAAVPAVRYPVVSRIAAVSQRRSGCWPRTAGRMFMPLLARILTAPLVVDVRRGRGRGSRRAARRPADRDGGPGRGRGRPRTGRQRGGRPRTSARPRSSASRTAGSTRRSRWASSCGPKPTRRSRASAAARSST